MTDMTDTQCAATATAQGSRGPCDGVGKCTTCLLTPGCMVGENADCVSQGSNVYNRGKHYHVAQERSLVLPAARQTNADSLSDRQAWLFPNPNTTYCPTDDAVCQDCVGNNFWAPPLFKHTGSDSRYCVGQGGCVCIFNCHVVALPECSSATPTRQPDAVGYYVQDWTPVSPETVSATLPPSPSVTRSSTSAEKTHATGSITTQLATWAPLPLAILIVLWVAVRLGKRLTTRRDPQPQLPSRPSRGTPFVAMARTPTGVESENSATPEGALPRLSVVPRASTTETTPPTAPGVATFEAETSPSGVGPQLELYGWISHRQYLIDTEHRRFNGDDDAV